MQEIKAIILPTALIVLVFGLALFVWFNSDIYQLSRETQEMINAKAEEANTSMLLIKNWELTVDTGWPTNREILRLICPGVFTTGYWGGMAWNGRLASIYVDLLNALPFTGVLVSFARGIYNGAIILTEGEDRA